MEIKEIKNIIETKEYDFLRENKYLKDRIILLTLGGSYAYGTNNENSDLDIRGICKTPIDTLFGLNDFEQFVETGTDTTIYSLNKITKLLMNCNPNTIEILGCKPEHYLLLSDIGKELMNNVDLFISQRCINSFGGYATAQLRRLQNALARDEYPQVEKEKHICGSINKKMSHLQKHYEKFTNEQINVYLDNSKKDDFEKEIFINIDLKHYPLRDFKDIYTEMSEVIKEYNTLNKRNKKKTEKGLLKHAMHLIRLHLMLLDILEGRGINTYRENDKDFLLDIRNGKYTYNQIFEMVNELDKKIGYAVKNTSVPKDIDISKIEEFIISINRRSI